MTPPFSRDEYADRLSRVRAAMEQREFDVLVIGDPANVNWLTGYDAWSFYTPQIMIVGLDCAPTWLGREMDAGAAAFTTYLPDEQVIPFPETLVQQRDVHPAQFMGDWMASKGFDGQRIGFESDVYFLTPSAVNHLKSRLPNATWSDCELLVNWVRLIKSPAEIAMLKQASTIAGLAMQTAYDKARPGVRQCDVMAEVVAAQIRGTPEFGGDMTALHPLVLAGEAASTAHPMWTDAPFESDQTIAFEIGGCRKRYNAGLARTAHIGTPPEALRAAMFMRRGRLYWTATASKRKAGSDIRSALAMLQIGANTPSVSAPMMRRPFPKTPSSTSSSGCGWMDGVWNSARPSMSAKPTLFA